MTVDEAVKRAYIRKHPYREDVAQMVVEARDPGVRDLSVAETLSWVVALIDVILAKQESKEVVLVGDRYKYVITREEKEE